MQNLLFAVTVLFLSLPAMAAETKTQPPMPAEKVAELAARAANGDADAQFQLAELRLKGAGVAQDFAKAAALYKSAAEAGHALAQVSYAGMNALGLGGERRVADAYFWVVAAVVMQPGPVRDAGFAGLGEVAAQLTLEEKAAMVPPARAAWSR
jgi:TPR repeat protein